MVEERRQVGLLQPQHLARPRSDDRRRGCPAACRHSNRATHPASSGVPPKPGSNFTPANPSPGSAKRSASPRCPALSTWIAKNGAASKAGKRRDFRAGDQSTSGGASDTLAKLLAVIPSGPRGVMVVTTVTPVAKRPSASRSSLSLKSGKHPPRVRAATV